MQSRNVDPREAHIRTIDRRSPIANLSSDEATNNLILVDVGEYFQVGPLDAIVPPEHWDRLESRVEQSTRRVLDLLDEYQTKATFFVLAWVARRHKALVSEIVMRGHEVGVASRRADLAGKSVGELREQLRHDRIVVENATGVEARGHRVPDVLSAVDALRLVEALKAEQFAYSASVIARKETIALATESSIVRSLVDGRADVLTPAIVFGGRTIPVLGGGDARQLPDSLVDKATKRWIDARKLPLVVSFHVAELDIDQPRITALPRFASLRQYRNLPVVAERLRCLLSDHRFAMVTETMAIGPAMPVNHIIEELEEETAPALPEVVEGQVLTPVSVVVPCYNEEETLGFLEKTLNSFSASVRDRYAIDYVFVDDGSKDKTWEKLNEFFGQRADCRVIQHPQNRGIAAATLTGIENSPSEIVCAIDADGTFDPHQLKTMIPMLTDDVDCVTSSCYHPDGGEVVNVPAWRRALSIGACQLYRMSLNNKLTHYTSCFRVYRRSAMAGMKLRDERYVGITEILCHLDAQGSRIVESPAKLETRLLGQSKMKTIKTIWGHLRLWAPMTVRILLGGGKTGRPSRSEATR